MIRKDDKVTRIFNSDFGQSDKCSVVEFRRDKIIPKGEPLTVDNCLNAAVGIRDREAGPAGRVRKPSGFVPGAPTRIARTVPQ